MTRRHSPVRSVAACTMALLVGLSIAMGPVAKSQPGPLIVNTVSNPGFETQGPEGFWEEPFSPPPAWFTNYDSTRARTSAASARLNATTDPSGSSSDYVGQSIFVSQNTSLANIADRPDTFSAWWYTEPETNGADSLLIEMFFSDGATRSYTLGYFYGSSDIGNATTSLHYRLGPVQDSTVAGWFETRRNVYQDTRSFNIKNPDSFHFTYIFFGATGNATHGETVWIDDVQLLFSPPIPAFTTTQPSPSELRFQFDASGSQPSEGASIIRYTWSLGDGSNQTYSQPSLTHIYSAPSAYEVTLEVEDSKGRVASSSRIVLAFTSNPNDTPGHSLFNPLVAYLSGLVLVGTFAFVILGRHRRRH